MRWSSIPRCSASMDDEKHSPQYTVSLHFVLCTHLMRIVLKWGGYTSSMRHYCGTTWLPVVDWLPRGFRGLSRRLYHLPLVVAAQSAAQCRKPCTTASLSGSVGSPPGIGRWMRGGSHTFTVPLPHHGWCVVGT